MIVVPPKRCFSAFPSRCLLIQSSIFMTTSLTVSAKASTKIYQWEVNRIYLCDSVWKGHQRILSPEIRVFRSRGVRLSSFQMVITFSALQKHPVASHDTMTLGR